jgi:hypothetical protein
LKIQRSTGRVDGTRFADRTQAEQASQGNKPNQQPKPITQGTTTMTRTIESIQREHARSAANAYCLRINATLVLFDVISCNEVHVEFKLPNGKTVRRIINY